MSRDCPNQSDSGNVSRDDLNQLYSGNVSLAGLDQPDGGDVSRDHADDVISRRHVARTVLDDGNLPTLLTTRRWLE
jgi:hypothetical protein